MTSERIEPQSDSPPFSYGTCEVCRRVASLIHLRKLDGTDRPACTDCARHLLQRGTSDE